MFKKARLLLFSCCMRQSRGSYTVNLHGAIRVVSVASSCCVRQLCRVKLYRVNEPKVSWPLKKSEAEVGFVMIQTLELFRCKFT